MKFTIPKLMLLLLLSMLTVACSKKEDQARVIPNDAIVVYHFDTKSLVQKSNFNLFEHPVLKGYWEMSKGTAGEEVQKIVEDFMKNPNSLGIDLKGDVFFYVAPSSSGLVAKVNSTKKIDKLLETIGGASEVEQRDDVNILSAGNELSVVWDKKLLLLALDSRIFDMETERGDDTPLVEKAVKQLKQTESESILQKESFATFLDSSKDISVYSAVSYDWISKLFSTVKSRYGSPSVIIDQAGNIVELPSLNSEDQIAQEAMDVILAQLKQLDGMVSTGYISFDKGAIHSKGNILFDKPEAKEQYDKLLKICPKQTGDLLEFISGSPLLSLSTAIDGGALNKFLKESKLTSLLEKTASSADVETFFTVLEMLNGDLAFSMDFEAPKTRKGEYFSQSDQMERGLKLNFVAQVKEPAATVEFVKNLFNGDSQEEENPILKKLGDNLYKVEVDMVIFFGAKDKNFFVTTDKTFYDNIMKGKTAGNEMSKLADGRIFSVSGAFKPLKQLLKISRPDPAVAKTLNSLIDLFASFKFYSEDPYTANGEILMSDKGTNSLESIFVLLDSFITQYMQEIAGTPYSMPDMEYDYDE